MDTTPERSPEFFAKMYEGTPPWDIGRPQRAFARLADEEIIDGEVLDAGCGTGENALYLAGLGHVVVGIDAAPAAIERARAKMLQRGLEVEFLVADALRLKALGRMFDTVIDSGLFHVFSDDDRVRYVGSLASAVRDEGRIFILCFSEREPGNWGPRRVTERELRDAFRDEWEVERIVPERLQTNLGHDVEGWLAAVRRVAKRIPGLRRGLPDDAVDGRQLPHRHDE
jgi:SAM-dependent methyltransferase